MKKLILPVLLGLAAVGCAVPRDTTRLEWYPHQVTAWVTTPGGHKRDAGPFKSVQGGFITDQEIDTAVDAAYVHFAAIFPGYKLEEKPIAINDDYAMFDPQVQIWVSGEENPTHANIGICMWTRGDGPADPGIITFIIRPPGVYWGVNYVDWRWTAKPLLPAIEHELLHASIGDGAHKRPEWNVLNANPR